MSTQEKVEQIIADGLDFRLPVNKAAVVNYLTRCLNVALESEPAARPNGTLTIQLANMEGRPGLVISYLRNGRGTFARRHGFSSMAQCVVPFLHATRRDIHGFVVDKLVFSGFDIRLMTPEFDPPSVYYNLLHMS